MNMMNIGSFLADLRFKKIRYFGVRTKADKLAIIDSVSAILKNDIYAAPYTCHHAQYVGGMKARNWLFGVWISRMGDIGKRYVFDEDQWASIAPEGAALNAYPLHHYAFAVRLYALDVIRNDVVGGKL